MIGFVKRSHSVNGNGLRMLLVVTCLIGMIACGGCASARRSSLSAEDKQTVAALREKFSAGVVDALLRTGDYTRSDKLNAEALARDAKQVRDAKVRAIAEQTAKDAAASLARAAQRAKAEEERTARQAAAVEARAEQQAAAAKEGPSVIESSVDGEFNGFDGDTVIRLLDGSLWEQTEFYWEWHWAYLPKATVFRSQGGGWKMQIEGIRQAVRVRRLK